MNSWLWWGVFAASAVYGAVFILAKRPVAIRSGRLGWMLLTVFSARCFLLFVGYAIETRLDAILTGATLLSAACFRMNEKVWLIRVSADELRQELQTACRGLFLECEEKRHGRFLLQTKKNAWPMRFFTLTKRLQLIFLPHSRTQGRVSLLVSWLSKQHPGPVPRIRVSARRRT